MLTCLLLLSCAPPLLALDYLANLVSLLTCSHSTKPVQPERSTAFTRVLGNVWHSQIPPHSALVTKTWRQYCDVSMQRWCGPQSHDLLWRSLVFYSSHLAGFGFPRGFTTHLCISVAHTLEHFAHTVLNTFLESR